MSLDKNHISCTMHDMYMIMIQVSTNVNISVWDRLEITSDSL